MGDRFAGQPRINALIVSGGCCHDYPGEAKILMDAVNRVLPVDWTAVVQGGSGTRGSMPVYADADWAKGFDIVIHNECLATSTIPPTSAGSPPPIATARRPSSSTARCTPTARPRSTTGASSSASPRARHTKPFNIPVKIAAADHPAMAGFKADWVTPVDELYVIEKIWPNTTRTGHGRQPRGQEGVPADLGERIRRQDARVRDDARARRRYVGRSGVSGPAGSRIQVGGQSVDR